MTYRQPTLLDTRDYHGPWRPDDYQRAVLRVRAGVYVVWAPGGSGKTTTATYLVAGLIDEGWTPRLILVLTFSRSARRTFRKTLASLVGSRLANQVDICTLHSFGCRFVEGGRIDEDHLAALVYELLGSTDTDALRQLRLARLRGTPHPDVARYDELKSERGLRDFDDLIDIGIEHLMSNPDVVRKYEAVIVDEAQDLNARQHLLVHLLRPQLKVYIGDPRQSIYAFQGADPLYLLQIANRPTTTILPLLYTYRCPRWVTDAANALTAASPLLAPLPPMVTTLTHTGRIDEVVVSTTKGAIRWIIEECRCLIAAGVRPEEIAVLARVGDDLDAVRLALREAGIAISGDTTSFWARTEVHAFLDMARLALDVTNKMAAARLAFFPYGGLRSQRLDRALKAIDEAGGAPEGYRALANLPGVGSRYRDLILPALEVGADIDPVHLYRALSEVDLAAYVREEDVSRVTTLRDAFVERVKEHSSLRGLLVSARHTDQRSDDRPQKTPGIRVETIHAAKGEEYKVVFVLWAEEGKLPHASADDLEEERRIANVAITRTADRLYLLRRDHKAGIAPKRSRYLEELEAAGVPLIRRHVDATKGVP